MATMTQDQWLTLLRCPLTKEPLIPLATARLRKLNKAIEQGKVINAAGLVVPNPLQSALLHPPTMRVYPRYEGVLLLHKDDAIDASMIL